MPLISRLPSGGGGKKSLILPDNTPVDLYSYDGKIVVKWQKPTASEVPIASYNLYWVQSNTKPTSLKGFTNKVSVSSTATEKEITGLTDGKMYWFVLESVSGEGYENASLRATNNMNAGIPYFVAEDSSSIFTNIWTSSDGKTWSTKTMNQYGSYVILFPFVFTSNLKFRFIRRYNDDGAKVLSTVSDYDFSNQSSFGIGWSDGSAQTNYPAFFYNAKGLTVISSSYGMYYVLDTANNMIAARLPDINGSVHYFLKDDSYLYTNGKFFARAEAGAGRYIYSEDGKTWNELDSVTIIGNNRYLLGYVNGYYIIAGFADGVFYTKDLSTFVKIADASVINNEVITLRNVFYANGYLIFFVKGYRLFCFKSPSDFFTIELQTSKDYSHFVLACKNGVVAFVAAGINCIEYIVTSSIRKGGTVSVIRTDYVTRGEGQAFCPNVNVNTINV